MKQDTIYKAGDVYRTTAARLYTEANIWRDGIQMYRNLIGFDRYFVSWKRFAFLYHIPDPSTF